MALVGMFGMNPAFAFDVVDKAAMAKNVPKPGNILKKIFLGSNSAGKFVSKAGDTRSELAGVLNAITMTLILGVWVTCAYFFQLRDKAEELKRLKKEVSRETNYREQMYFDAVQTLLDKINSPKTKPGVKSTLTRQMKV
jgi:hypothetical protein